jgi:hypothetical protein
MDVEALVEEFRRPGGPAVLHYFASQFPQQSYVVRLAIVSPAKEPRILRRERRNSVNVSGHFGVQLPFVFEETPVLDPILQSQRPVEDGEECKWVDDLKRFGRLLSWMVRKRG